MIHTPSSLWVDQNTVKSSTGITLFQMMHGVDRVLSIKLEVPTWKTLPWEWVHSTEDLLALHACQIEHWDCDTEEAVLQVQHHREENWERYNDWNQLRDTPLEEGSLVLLHNIKQETSYTDKLVFQWFSPFQICEVRDNGSYLLEELDGTRFSTSV